MMLSYITLEKLITIIAGMGISTSYFIYLYIFSFCSFFFMFHLLCQTVAPDTFLALAKMICEASN